MNYPKINSLFKRSEPKPRRLIWGQWTWPEFEVLQHLKWDAYEKLDGTNIAVEINFDSHVPASTATWRVKGRTENAQIPAGLLEFVQTRLYMRDDLSDLQNIELFGEGIGKKIQEPMGSKYYALGQQVVLFDVRVGDFWLRYDDVKELAARLGFSVVPYIGAFTIEEAAELVRAGFESLLPGAAKGTKAEGVIMHAPLGMRNRHGNRIITKIKNNDFAAY